MRLGTFRVPWESQTEISHPLPVRSQCYSLSRRPQVTSGLEGVNRPNLAHFQRGLESDHGPSGKHGTEVLGHRCVWRMRPGAGLTARVCSRRTACPLTPGFAALRTHLVLTSTQQTWGCASSQLDTLRMEGRPQRPPRKVLLQGEDSLHSPESRVESGVLCQLSCIL